MWKKILAVVFLIAVTVIPFIPKKEKASPKERPPSKAESRFINMLSDETIVLVALKYGLPPETVKGVLADYSHARDSSLLSGKFIFPDALSTEGVIDAISKKNDLPAKTIASIIISEAALNKCPEGYDGPEQALEDGINDDEDEMSTRWG